jgi:hypothetical protein
MRQQRLSKSHKFSKCHIYSFDFLYVVGYSKHAETYQLVPRLRRIYLIMNSCGIRQQSILQSREAYEDTMLLMTLINK